MAQKSIKKCLNLTKKTTYPLCPIPPSGLIHFFKLIIFTLRNFFYPPLIHFRGPPTLSTKKWIVCNFFFELVPKVCNIILAEIFLQFHFSKISKLCLLQQEPSSQQPSQHVGASGKLSKDDYTPLYTVVFAQHTACTDICQK